MVRLFIGEAELAQKALLGAAVGLMRCKKLRRTGAPRYILFQRILEYCRRDECLRNEKVQAILRQGKVNPRWEREQDCNDWTYTFKVGSSNGGTQHYRVVINCGRRWMVCTCPAFAYFQRDVTGIDALFRHCKHLVATIHFCDSHGIDLNRNDIQPPPVVAPYAAIVGRPVPPPVPQKPASVGNPSPPRQPAEPAQVRSGCETKE